MPKRTRQFRESGQRAVSSRGVQCRIPIHCRSIGAVAALVVLGGFPSHGFAADQHLDAAEAPQAGDPPALSRSTDLPAREPASASPRTPKKQSSEEAKDLAQSLPRSNALAQAIHQNTPGNSQGFPEGLAWDKGFYGASRLKPAPSGFSALTAWAVVYREAGAPVRPEADDFVQVANFTTYVHLANGAWLKVQDQARAGIQGAHYVADFSGDAHIPFSMETLPDGSVSMNAPAAGYNDHFWPGKRGSFAPGTVDGVFVTADMKTSDAGANLVAQIGADWWRDADAVYVSGFLNNPAVGGNNFTRLTAQWQTLYYTTLSSRQLQADPPPALLEAAPIRR